MLVRPKQIPIRHIDNAYRRAALLCGRSLAFQFLLRPSTEGLPLDGLRQLPAVLGLSQDGEYVGIKFDHNRCDAIGAIQLIRVSMLGMPPIACEFFCPPAGRGKRVPRRPFTRATSGSISLIPATPEYHIVRFVLKRVGADKTVTESTVIALHEIALQQKEHGRRHATIVVAVSAALMSPRRPTCNLSSAFLSVATPSELRGGRIEELVSRQFSVARAGRVELLRRTAKFGRWPRPLTICTDAIAKITGPPKETAVVSNLGTLMDPVLLARVSEIYFVPPIRSTTTLAVGIVGLHDRVFATLAGHGSSAALESLAMRLWTGAGFGVEEMTRVC